MSVASLVILGVLVVLRSAEVPAAPPECVATAMLAEARAKVPVTEEMQQLRARLSDVSKEADAAEKASDRRERRWHCMNALLAFADIALEALGRERGESEATRARQLAVELSLANGSYIGPRAPPPALTPEQKWERRRRRLVGHTAASGVFTGIGVLLLTVPWAALAVCAARNPDPLGFRCGEGYGAIIMSGIGAPIFVGSVIPLGIWSYRLHMHLQARSPGIAIFGGRARVQLLGSSLRLDF